MSLKHMFGDFLSRLTSNKHARRRGRQRKWRHTQLQLEALEARDVPVVGATALPPPVLPTDTFADLDNRNTTGVVQILTPGGAGTGSLLYTGRHILTAAHIVDTNLDGVVDSGMMTVQFDMPGTIAGSIQRIWVQNVPLSNAVMLQGWNGDPRNGHDLAVIELPVLAPSGPTGVGAERYDLYRNNDEVGQSFTFLGYGRTNWFDSNGNLQVNCDQPNGGIKRAGQNDFDEVSGTNLTFDFDNVAGEMMIAFGDSGGPSFIDGRIAGVHATLDDARCTIGTIGGDTRVSTYAQTIDVHVERQYDLVLDMTSQLVGNDFTEDQIEVRVDREPFSASWFQLFVNGELYHADFAGQIRSITIRGSNDRDVFTVPHDLQMDITVDGQVGNDELIITGSSELDIVNVAGPIVSIGSQTVNHLNLEQITIDSRGGNDAIGVIDTTAVVDVRAGAGVDFLVVRGTSRSDQVVIDGLSIAIGPGWVNHSGVENVKVDTLGGDDRVDVNGIPSSLSLIVEGGDGADEIKVRSTSAGSSLTLNAGQGMDTVNLGNANGTLDGIEGHLTINGGPDHDEVKVNDLNAGDDKDYFVGHDELIHSLSPWNNTSLGVFILPNMLGYSEIEELTLDAGSGSDDITLGQGNLDLFPFNLTVNGNGGTDTLVVDDRDNLYYKRDYTLGANAITRTPVVGRSMTIGHDPFEAVELRVGSGGLPGGQSSFTMRAGSVIDVHSLPPSLTIHASDQRDTINLGRADLYAFSSEVTINGGIGMDVLRINDQNALGVTQRPRREYTVTSKEVTVQPLDYVNTPPNGLTLRQPTVVAYSGINSLVLLTGAALTELGGGFSSNQGTTVTVKSTPSGTPTTISGTNGPDTVSLHGWGLASVVTVEGGSGHDFIAIHGTIDGEMATLRAGSAEVVGPGYTVLTVDAEENIVYGGGGLDVGTLYDVPHAKDLFVRTSMYSYMTDYDRTGSYYNTVHAFHQVTGQATPGDEDVAALHDSSANDRLEARPDTSVEPHSINASMTSAELVSHAHGFDRVIAYSAAGGFDEAHLYDDPTLNDTFITTSAYGRFRSGPTGNLEYFAYGFDRVTGYSTGGVDAAYLYDTAGKDTFDAYPTYATLTSPGLQRRAEGFASVWAVANSGGHDVARLHGSAGDELLVSYPDISHLDGTGFRNVAIQFEAVYADDGGAGYDRALMYDSPRADRFVARPTHSYMTDGQSDGSGTTYWNQANGFDRVSGYSQPTDFTDRAYLFDSPRDDRFVARPTWSYMTDGSPTGEGQTYWNDAFHFGRVDGYSTGANTYDLAYMFDSVRDDRFTGRPRESYMTDSTPSGENLTYWNQFNNYANVGKLYVFADSGGDQDHDRAYLYDSAGNDSLKAESDWLELSGTGFYHRLQDFDSVQATSGAGDWDAVDIASALHYLLTLVGDWEEDRS